MLNTTNNKRIAKNTFILYIRMFFTMGVSLYTSRIILNTLGVEDFGIYNVVGGVVTMFAFLNNAMTAGTQRFLSFDLARDNLKQFSKTFSMSINTHFVIAVIILIISETIGLWFLNTKLVIPAERLGAANWVFQFSVFALIVTVISVPYNATIIAHERMSVYAYVSIIEVALKLFIVFVLQWFGFDKLKFYAVLVFVVALIIRIIYWLYTKRNFKECNYLFSWDKTLFKTLISYGGWNLWGNFAIVSINQGINILLNLFFGPTINAARGIAFQVNVAINGFVSNFQMALNPQIVKSFAKGDREYMHKLIFQGSKYSFFLIYILSLPIILEADTILSMWLKVVPDFTVLFCRLVLINLLIDCISGPLITAAQASGKIKKYHTIVGGFLLLVLPVSYFFLQAGFPPQTTFYVSIVISFIVLFIRLWIVHPLVGLSIKTFFLKVLMPIIFITPLAIITPAIFKYNIQDQFIRFILVAISSVLSSSILIYLLGLSKPEREFVKSKVTGILKIK